MNTSLNINLLPPEILKQQFKKTQFYKVQTISIMIILTVVFLTSITIALRILQGKDVTEVSARVTQSEQRVSDLKNTQANLLLLNDRLTAINKFWGVSSPQSILYRLIYKLTPDSVTISSISIDKAGQVTFTATMPDSQNLDTFVNNLTDQEENEGKISEVSIDSLNRGRDGIYRVSFKVKAK